MKKKDVLTFKAAKLKIVEFANSIDPGVAAHNEWPHPDLSCLHLSL